ncbi:metal ABC transporter permease [Marimonas lutisalis]|uniref:metal ABC transporter permease n=1 Tax=Marimonas lutisalis TaxID=2545756 RepID=UPI0010F89E19|nr:metal ABC transporter permease [Marimonas lutisalis]
MFGLGYNAILVTVGAGLLGASAGLTGTFLFLRKRALVSDAIAHATLPGVALAFVVMVALGGDGRALPGLMAGSALSAWLGLLAVGWLSRHTRLAEDAAIGAILSVFFGAGIVGLTVIQSLNTGRQAGLETFLLGSTAGMLFTDAMIIAIGGALAVVAVILLRRPMLAVCFDPGYAAATGRDVHRIDLAMMGLVMAVTVVGLKIVGLVLIVALLIIPPVAARFWSDEAGRVVLISGLIGAFSGATGAILSASAPNLPTGPLIVLAAFAVFAASFVIAPKRGLLASVLWHLRYRRRVHLRQGLLALAQGHPIYEAFTMRLLRRAGLARADGVATDQGRAAAANALLDERRWQILRSDPKFETTAALYDGLRPIDTVLTPDQITQIDRGLGPRGAA